MKNGYWRESITSDLIVECQNNRENCRGEERNALSICKEGYIGPLCEQCDLKGEIWSSKYMNDG